jgi:TRAP-type C4-dicarboxylate transport system substrate-binding protein
MRTNKLFYTVIVSFILLALVLGITACSKTTTSSTPASQTTTQATTPVKEVLIRVTTPVPAGDEFVDWAQAGMDKFNARTGGAYKMQMFPGGQLGPFPESLDAIRTGAIEAGMIPLAAFGGSIPELGLAELPL